MTTRAVPLLAAAALLAASTTAFAATPPPGAENTKPCGDVATANGGKARYIRTSKVSCPTAKAVARKGNGKGYRTKGFVCIAPQSGIVLCTKNGGKSGRVVYQYKKPARK